MQTWHGYRAVGLRRTPNGDYVFFEVNPAGQWHFVEQRTGLPISQAVADYLAIRGMPFRRAHEIVGAMVRRLLAEGRDFSSLSLKEWKEASDFFGDDAPQAATSLESVHAKRTPQSTNPDAVQVALKDLKDWLNPKPRIPHHKSQ